MLLPPCVSSGCEAVATVIGQASPTAGLWSTSAIVPNTRTVATMMTSSVVMPLTTTLLGLSGGGAATPKHDLDVGRFKLRLDGLHTYAVITTLLMNASLRLFSSTPKRFQEGERFRNGIKILFSVMVTISILMGSYTTIVFSLLELYSKRALGRHMDVAVAEFFQRTQPVRELAYDTWIGSLVSFQVSFCLSLFLNHDEGWDWKIAIMAGVAGVWCWWKWSTVMTLASAILQLGSDM